MKMKRLLTNFGITLVVAAVTLVFLNAESTQNYVPRDLKTNGANGMIEWLKSQRADYKTGEIDYDYVKQVESQIFSQKNARQSNDFELKWQEMGPDKVGGRTRSVLVDKDNSQVIYAGSVSGGLWKTTNGAQTWFKIDDNAANLSVTTLCQTTNGNIFYGTGEQIGTGFIGNGISISTDGINFTVLTNTSDFKFVNKLVAKDNTVYAATKKGLYSTTDNGANWVKLLIPESSIDVAVGNNGNVYTMNAGKAYKSNDGSENSFTAIDGLPHTNVWNAKFDVSESNPNYVYCSMVFNTYNNPFNSEYQDFNIFKSTDAGATWESIRGNYTSAFQPYKKQGHYNNVLKVFPNDENRIILGGVDMYTWDTTTDWEQVSYWIGDHEINQDSYYLHADQHAITFDPNFNGTTNKKIYFGNDGGVFISSNSAQTFTSFNLNYSVTQFYSVAAGPKGTWVAGAQDNGTQYNALQGSNLNRTTEVMGGDGFECGMSVLNSEMKFVSLYYGSISRISEDGAPQRISLTSQDADFYTSLAFWESMYDETSIDSVYYTFEDKGIKVGDTIIAYSNQGRRPLPYILSMSDLPTEISDTCSDCVFPQDYEIIIWDTYQSLFAYPTDKGIYMSTRALNLSSTGIYLEQINEIGGTGTNASNLVFSKDGNTLFFSQGNAVYKTTNILNARKIRYDIPSEPRVTLIDMDKVITQKIGTFNGNVTSISTDPEISNNIIVTLGGFNSNSHIYYSTNAATTVSENISDNFADVNGNLPGIPVYSSLVAWNDSRKVAVGTEYGVYTTEDITDAGNSVWVKEEIGLPNVAVFGLFQQTFKNEWENGVINHGYIYAATYGRGVFMSRSNSGPVGIDDIANANKSNKVSVILYPNPVNDVANVKFELTEHSDVNINVYSISGAIVYSNTYNGTKGDNNLTINTSSYKSGTYFVKVSTENSNEVVKMIVR